MNLLGKRQDLTTLVSSAGSHLEPGGADVLWIITAQPLGMNTEREFGSVCTGRAAGVL